VEDLKVKGTPGNRGLARSLAGCYFGEFSRRPGCKCPG